MTGRPGTRRTLKVAALARVEGEGGLDVRIRDGTVTDVRLRIYEPPRFFEGLLRGRRYTEPPDITARICGICPVAYQMSACQAVEHACGVRVDGPVRDLRRLLYCGEWIESHALHVYLLHAPDFLGYPGALEMARDHREVVERGLSLKEAGNDLVAAVAGRAIHPVNVRVGGFHRAPTARELDPLRARLEQALADALATVRWVSAFDVPDLAIDATLVALRHPSEYAVLDGRLTSTGGLDLAVERFGDAVVETQVPHSTALHGRLVGDDRTYLVGPLARFALNADRLRPAARAAAADAGLDPSCRNPFRMIVVRAVEIVHAVEEALAILEGYEAPDPPAVVVEPQAGIGHGASEAPRGVLYHRYELAADGTIAAAVIVPPTSQNQPRIEEDLRLVVEAGLHLDDAELTQRCEQAIRNYDPCISCATHFLTLTVDRDGPSGGPQP